jgi:TldD protein
MKQTSLTSKSPSSNMKSIKSQSKQAIPAFFVLAITLATASVTNRALAESKPADDPMLKAMQAELDREKSALVLPGMQRPYFMEYRLEDLATYEAIADYGALTREEDTHQRFVRVTVRIGDYAADSSTSRGDGVVQLGPQDNNPEALRYALWIATDDAYKNALRSYATKQAALKQFQSTPNHEDFARATPTIHIEPLVTLDIDRKEWKRRIIEASGLYASDPAVKANAEHVQYSVVNVRGLAVNRYIVNTEGTAVRNGSSAYNATISVGAQAPDGMRLTRSNGTNAALSRQLESWTAFRKRTIDDLTSLEALRNAPVVSADDYHGPVLFSGDASADVFNRLFVPNVEADRPEVGTAARTQGAYTSSLHASVLPDFLDVTDDPKLKTFAGHDLIGSYEVDDEGVPAQSVDVVAKGKLENFLIDREPVKDFPASNGHGRAAIAQPAHSHSGILLVKSLQPLSDAAMNQRLLALAKEQGHDVYAVETLGNELSPRLLYRVAPDGTRTLVRGAVFDELDTRSLRSDILAAGGEPYISDSLGTILQTTISPSLLFGNIGVKRANDEQQKLPYYPPPPQESK